MNITQNLPHGIQHEILADADHPEWHKLVSQRAMEVIDEATRRIRANRPPVVKAKMALDIEEHKKITTRILPSKKVRGALRGKETARRRGQRRAHITPRITVPKMAMISLPAAAPKRTAHHKSFSYIDTPRHEEKKRPCMCCADIFTSQGPHNRLCSSCRNRSDD